MVKGTVGTQTAGSSTRFADEITQEVFGKTFAARVAEYAQFRVFGRAAMVHPEFGAKLVAADAAARTEIEKTEDRTFKVGDWQISSIGGYGDRPGGLHPMGLALDIDVSANPYIANEKRAVGEAEVDRQTTPVYHRIALLMLDPPGESVIPGGAEIPKGAAGYDRLRRESDAMIAYFALMNDDTKRAEHVEARADVLTGDQWSASSARTSRTPTGTPSCRPRCAWTTRSSPGASRRERRPVAANRRRSRRTPTGRSPGAHRRPGTRCGVVALPPVVQRHEVGEEDVGYREEIVKPPELEDEVRPG
jgi:hypothetical protein